MQREILNLFNINILPKMFYNGQNESCYSSLACFPEEHFCLGVMRWSRIVLPDKEKTKIFL